MPSLNTFLIGLVISVLAIAVYLALLSLTNPVLIKLGLRNIPRRPAQSVLIVIGLTLSTIIIISSLSTGDTLNYSVRRHAISAYGKIDEIIAPPLLSLLATLGEEGRVADDNAEPTEAEAELNRLLEGGLTTVLTVLEGGLPGISVERYAQLRAEAEAEPLIDAMAASILFPTILRNVNSGQGEPLGFIFAVDNDYDQQFGLTNIEGLPVEIEELRPGVGNIFAQAANLFIWVENAGDRLGLEDFTISDVALATAAVGAALTAAGSEDGVDLANIHIDLATLQALGIDTAPLEAQGIESLSLETLGLNAERLRTLGVTTTTVGLSSVGIDASSVQSATANLLNAVNLNTLGAEIDRVLAQVGLQLRQGDVYLNRLGAEKLDAAVGDVLEIYIGPIPIPFRVRAIVEEAGPIGALLPVVILRLDETQQLLFMKGKVNNVLVSNQGDEVAGLAHTAAVSERLRVLALDPDVVARAVEILRRPRTRAAIGAEAAAIEEQAAEEFDGPLFLAPLAQSLGETQAYLRKVKALPAALDQAGVSDELRALLADNNLRRWLTEQRLPAEDAAELSRALRELNQFDLLDPLSKSTVIAAAGVGGVVFTSIFSVFGVSSILAGVLLIFLIFVMLAAERRGEMGIARAVGIQRGHLVQMFVSEGMVYDLAAAALGVGLGLAISYVMVDFIGRLFNDVVAQFGQSGLFRIYFRAAPSSIVIAYCLGVLFTFLVVLIASWRVSRLNIVAAIRDLPELPSASRASRLGQVRPLLVGLLLALGGGGVLIWGAPVSFSLVLAGVSLTLAGTSFLAGWGLERALRAEQAQRLVYTLIGAGLLVIWGAPWERWLGWAGAGIGPDNPWVLLSFALTAPMIILGAILVIMFNADTWTWGISRVLGSIGALTPVLKTAIAYPLSARFRTGVAMLLFAMIVSTVTIMSVVIEATQTIAASDSERNAGFDISTSFSLLSFFDPVEDLEAELAGKPDFPQQAVAAVGGVVAQDVEAQPAGAESLQADGWRNVRLIGVTQGYLRQAEQAYTFKARAPGYASDAAVWQALRERDDVAVATANLISRDEDGRPSSDETPPEPGEHREEWRRRLRLTDISLEEALLPEIHLALRASTAEKITHRVQIIGVIAQGATLAGNGIQANLAALAAVTGEAVAPTDYYIKVREGADIHEVAQALERTFLSSALNATVMVESFAQGQAVTRGILQLFQGFLALGLLVGIAALGVISTRTVVERRQQVGVLRAIGFQPGMVALSFLLESSFIGLTGIAVGAAAGVALGQKMVGRFFDVLADGRAFQTPWLEIAGIVLLAYFFSLLTTILPAYQAARIYPAEALRYE